jgi:hypothetical protein
MVKESKPGYAGGIANRQRGYAAGVEVLVFVIDRQDLEQPVFGYARPLIVGGRGLELNEGALHVYERRLRSRLAQN